MSSARFSPRRLARPLRVSAAGAIVGFAVSVIAGCGSGAPASRANRVAQRSTLVAEAPDPLAGKSFPLPAGAPRHANARSPRKAAREAFVSPGAPSNEQIVKELNEEKQADETATKSEPHARVNSLSGNATPQAGVPLKIAEVFAGGNEIADFPYVYGGGHRSFVDNAYDCSGSVSYALAAAGLIGAPETSGQLMSWGAPGQGRYLTVFATVGHTFMYVDGLWFDTAGRAGPYSTRWLTQRPSLVGYVERHYPGL
jgi:cell wall-associated NlpC family hydrolase